MPSYMYLFRAPKRLFSGPPRSAGAQVDSLKAWRAWEEALRAGGHEPTGAQLDPTGNSLLGPGAALAEGALGDDLIGGYFVVKAAHLAAATELAKGCPVLQSGGSVEVRPVAGT